MRYLLLLALIGLTACAGTPLPSVPLSAGYERMGFSTNGGANVMLFVRTYREGDTVGLCGAWGVAAEYKAAERAAEIFMRDGKIFLGGTELRTNLLFMKEFGPNAALETTHGNCVDTGVPWRAEFADKTPRLELERWSL